VKVDAMLQADTLTELAAEARAREAAGYDGLWSFEGPHDPFLQLVPVAEHTERISIGTAIAVAFARTPMTTAYVAHDLQVHSRGRFLLGLGSQVRPHVERRFAMPWSHPARRMREFVQALRAIWRAWDGDERLNFRGEFYTHTLMTPFFSPPPSPYGPPAVYLAAVGELMTRTAGEVCDGLQPHPFTSRRYLQERTLPALQDGLAAAGRSRADVAIMLAGLVATGSTEEEMATAVRRVREQVAFYASTPAYRSVLELHGWDELGVELNRISRGRDEDRWRRMGDLVDDTVLHEFAVVAEPDRLGDAVLARFGGLVDRFTFSAPYPHSPAVFEPAVEVLRGAAVS
jgi:probable F420-dependent oxidoreductase